MIPPGATASKPQPSFATERLLLRPFQYTDGADVERLAGDRLIADTTKHIPHPYPEGAAAEWIATHADLWANGTGAPFAVVERATDTLVGGIGLVIDDASRSAELGYWIGVPHWNKGHASEAGRAVLAFGFRLGLHRIEARHLTRNPASGRVMQKLGMTFEGILREATRKWDTYEDLAVYSILDREWEAAQVAG
ncbi:MAG: GNAT family N-acetyltransferase [Gemmatimonadota bacterium]